MKKLTATLLTLNMMMQDYPQQLFFTGNIFSDGSLVTIFQ